MLRYALKLAFLLFLALPASAQTPQTGWWYSTTEGGRGYAIEHRNGKVFMAALMYSTGGEPTWYLGQGPLISGSVLSDLEFYGLGTNVYFSYTPAQRLGSTAILTSFTSSSTATMSFLDAVQNNASSLTRFEITPGGIAAGANAGLPESGWWWAPSEPGVGYFIEFQKNSFYLGMMHYLNPALPEDAETPGHAVWDVAIGTMTTPTSLQATLLRYRGGQSLGGAYKTPTFFKESATLNITFSSTTTATMSVVRGKTLALERYRF